MSEQDFRDALRKTMDAQTPPPAMSDAPVLEAAHRDRRRRRTLWASVGSAAAVAAIAVGVVVAAPSGSGGDGAQVANQPPQPRSTQDAATTTSPAPGSETSAGKDTLPPGMTDRTQRSGPEYERGAALATALDEVLTNAGFGVPGDLARTGELAGAELKWHQANYDDKVDGVEQWSYLAVAPVTKGNGVGEVTVETRTPRDETPECAPGSCQEITVDGKTVGFKEADDPGQEHVDQIAFYRYDDGTVVTVSQSADYGFTDHPPLAGQPFTPEQLAALAVDSRFKVTE